MNCKQSAAARQQLRVLSHARSTDAYGFFNLLTGPRLLTDVEELLPKHRERLFPPTETLSMYMAQVLSADGTLALTEVDPPLLTKTDPPTEAGSGIRLTTASSC